MADYQRGTVTKITFEIAYPDGSTKTSEVDNASNLTHIAFDSGHVSDNDLDAFNVSTDDWKENPAMMIYGRTEGGGGLPFCTHNGCKL